MQRGRRSASVREFGGINRGLALGQSYSHRTVDMSELLTRRAVRILAENAPGVEVLGTNPKVTFECLRIDLDNQKIAKNGLHGSFHTRPAESTDSVSVSPLKQG